MLGRSCESMSLSTSRRSATTSGDDPLALGREVDEAAAPVGQVRMTRQEAGLLESVEPREMRPNAAIPMRSNAGRRDRHCSTTVAT
jgi:hypothetical protein